MCNLRLPLVVFPLVLSSFLFFTSFFSLSIIPSIAHGLAVLLIYLLISWNLSVLIAELIQADKSSSGRTVLITGCDSGIGLNTALNLYESGFDVIATCLDTSGPGASELRQKGKGHNHMNIVQLNVTWSEEDLKKVRQEVESILDANSSVFWGLVNNAGVTAVSPLEWGEFKAAVQDVIDVNLIGLIKTTRVFLPLIRRNKGRIVNIASMASKIPIPFTPAYAASKAGVLSITNTVRANLNRWNVKVSAIIPYAHQSNMTSSPTNMIDKLWASSSDEVKQAYGEAYKDRFTRFFAEMVSAASSPENVSTAVRRCLLAQDPPSEVICCPVAIKIVLVLCKIFPQEWIDCAFQLMESKFTRN